MIPSFSILTNTECHLVDLLDIILSGSTVIVVFFRRDRKTTILNDFHT